MTYPFQMTIRLTLKDYLIMQMEKEIKETIVKCAELLKTLRTKLLELKTKEERTSKDIVCLYLLFAIEKNIFSVNILLRIKYNGYSEATYLKMPIGLLLRACCEYAITSTYLLQLKEEQLHQELRNRKAEYSFSLLERERVYIDNVNSVDKSFSDELASHLYELNLEDWFLDDLSITAADNDLKAIKPNKAERQDRNIGKSRQIAEMYRELQENNSYVEAIYAYYKYFSQYEHFSFEGFGDAFVPFDSDNVHIPSCIGWLNFWVMKSI